MLLRKERELTFGARQFGRELLPRKTARLVRLLEARDIGLKRPACLKGLVEIFADAGCPLSRLFGSAPLERGDLSCTLGLKPLKICFLRERERRRAKESDEHHDGGDEPAEHGHGPSAPLLWSAQNRELAGQLLRIRTRIWSEVKPALKIWREVGEVLSFGRLGREARAVFDESVDGATRDALLGRGTQRISKGEREREDVCFIRNVRRVGFAGKTGGNFRRKIIRSPRENILSILRRHPEVEEHRKDLA